MPSIEEILADLEDDDSPKEPESSGEEQQTPSDNSTIRSIRQALKDAEKRAKAAEAKVLEFETEKRTNTVKGVFKELELPERQAELFLKTHDGEVTSDAIRQFVTDFGLKDLSGETGGTTEEKSQGFEPGGTGGSAPEPKFYSLDEVKQMPADQVEALAKAGRLKLDQLPGNLT